MDVERLAVGRATSRTGAVAVQELYGNRYGSRRARAVRHAASCNQHRTSRVVAYVDVARWQLGTAADAGREPARRASAGVRDDLRRRATGSPAGHRDLV